MSNSNLPEILVPTDFSEVGKCALEHALKIASVIDGQVTLLHVVGKEKEVASKETQVEEKAKEAAKRTGITVKGMVSVGNIFDDIGGIASKIKAQFIFMGTHGAKGLQKVTGSYALRVITNSEVPFVVVQKKGPAAHGYSKLVLPLDLTKESVQQMRFAAAIAKHFNSEIHILGEKHGDSGLRAKVKSNIVVAYRYLKNEGVNAVAEIAKGSKSFDKEVLAYAEGVGADLISIVNVQDSILSMFGGFEQNIIANPKEIPALVVNPRVTTKTGGFLLGQ
ncbi:MAG: universal stress protein [Salibacteraceae bacterium]